LIDTGRHRRTGGWPGSRIASLGALAVALLAAGYLLALPEQTQAKAAEPSSAAGLLPDHTAYQPGIYFDANTALGTAPSPDGGAIRLLSRTGSDTPKELHRLPTNQNPQFNGFVAAGDQVVWAESTVTAQGRTETRLWKANWRTGTPAQALTADTGDIVFFNSQYDLVVADGRVYWAAAGASTEPVTEVRSVPLSGGNVTIVNLPGAYSLTAWPWLVSVAGGQATATELHNLKTDQRVRVAVASTELVSCDPTWCRALVLSTTGGPARFDLMHPDGSQRQRVAGPTASSSLQDVTLLDRFVALSQSTGAQGAGPGTNSQQLLIYDVKRKTTTVMATGVGVVLGRGGILWWSTGENAALVWHALDLHTMP
jgi:hypothetical protein